MYEFTDKDTRKKFKATEYGKKTNKMFYIALPFGMIALVFYILIITNIIKIDEMTLRMVIGLIYIAIIIMCYFDGKRDGAIEQYKIDQKK